MTPRNGAAPRPTKPEGTRTPKPTTTKGTGAGHDLTPRRVWAVGYEPAPGRRWPLLLVRSCPGCGGVHHHRGGNGLRRAGCGTRYYLLVRGALAVAS